MTKGDIIVGLDIGTSSVRTIIGELDGQNVNIIGVGTAKSVGIKKGAIIDIDAMVAATKSSIEHAERMVGISIHAAYVGVSGAHIGLHPSHGIVAVSTSDHEIGDVDVERVIEAARVMNLPNEREIIDVVPRQFTVDGLTEVADPRGMIGVRLEVDSYVVTGSRTVLHNLLRCVERSGLEVAGMVLLPLASADMVLTQDEKKLGVVLVDFGAGSVGISIFQNGMLEQFDAVPIGGDSVTNDITIGLQCGTEVAESIKHRYGVADVTMAKEQEKFKISRTGSSMDKECTTIELANIIEPRMREIFALVRQRVERLGYGKGLSGGYVLTGGGMLLKGADKLAEQEFEAPVRVAIPDYVGVRDPSYVGCVGMIKYVSRFYSRVIEVSNSAPVRRMRTDRKTWERIRNWFSDFL
nr:cell division protein FtsA [Bacilli bacterium]